MIFHHSQLSQYFTEHMTIFLVGQVHIKKKRINAKKCYYFFHELKELLFNFIHRILFTTLVLI